MIVLFARWRGLDLVVASDDQIAAELSGLAFEQLTQPSLEDRESPWENALVQHGTELELGVRSPAAIDAKLLWSGDEITRERAKFLDFGAELLARMGVMQSV
jgi:hypothetical protein